MPLSFYPEPQIDEARVRELTRRLSDKYLRPFVDQDDRDAHFRRDVFNLLAKEGLTAVSIPKQYGGQENSYRCYYAAMEEIARGSTAMSIAVGVTNLVQGALLNYGNEEQKQQYLKPMASGELLGAFALSEPHSGSDAADLRLCAKRVEGGYRLTGNKVWCSTAGNADLYLVMGRTGADKYQGITSFLVPAKSPGFRVGKIERKLGLHASTLAELIFEDCFVPEGRRIGREGEGFTVALSQLDAGRVTIGAAGIAITIEALEHTWKYLLKQKKAGIEISEGALELLGDSYAMVQAVKNLVTTASTLRDENKPFTTVASQVKLLASDLAMKTASDCITLVGPPGMTDSFPLERLLREAKSLQIVEGTNQIQRLVLYREVEAMMIKDSL